MNKVNFRKFAKVEYVPTTSKMDVRASEMELSAGYVIRFELALF